LDSEDTELWVMVGLVNTVMTLCCAATQEIKDLIICVA